MQIPRSGDLVRVRRARWRIVDVRAHDRCHVLTLQGASASNAGVERRVLSPFDIVEPVETRRAPHFVRTVVWRRICRRMIAEASAPGLLGAARAARIDLLAYQLEPALAIVRGLATRMLLADEVGLGKTIQAGLVAAELRERGAFDRALILTPAGLRDQWAGELAHRFSIEATAVDGPVLRRTAASLPMGMNPWQAIPIAVASIDYVKRAEVLPAVSACQWDVVIVDEAHGVCGESDRHAAAHALAMRASYVLLLTATPHSGDARAFTLLCRLGAVDDRPLTVFRRTRADVGLGLTRRVHLVRVKPRDAERRMHALLARYGDALAAERKRDGLSEPLLALSVLHKRAFSSAWSLAESVARRLAAIVADDAPIDSHQLGLPLGDPTGDLVRDDEPPLWPEELRFADARRERRVLTALLVAARAAAGDESKLHRLNVLLRRAHEPALVFTEYRDTLEHLRRRLHRAAIVLHGGMTREERAAALVAFAASDTTVLLATDAAAEGLNLHDRCRIVVNLELPWNPMRLEQRIGRIDRIGQRRTVHAFHLVAGDSGELRLAERLRRRLAAAAEAIGAPNPLDDEPALARLVLRGDDNDGIQHNPIPDDAAARTRD